MSPLNAIQQLIHQKDGPLTRELIQNPNAFGLGRLPQKLTPVTATTAVCGFCSTGCGLEIHLNENKEAINLTATTEYPVNLGQACPKGWEALSPLEAPDRATSPMKKENGKLVPIPWEEALKLFVKKFKGIQDKHGKASLAFLSTGQICNEEMALLGSLAKFGMGMIHGDGNTRQCMATAVSAYKQSFGFDAPPYTYEDYEESDVIVFVGANPCIAHPIMWERVCKNPHNPTIIVLDPRKTETAMQADYHLALTPRSDLYLLYALCNVLIELDYLDNEYISANTEDFEEFANHVKTFSPETVEENTGISKTMLYEVAQKIGRGKRVSFWWTMGVNQGHQSTRTAQAIINMALMTGNMGKPGTGANSITGQTNAMGSRLVSNTTSLLGGRNFTHEEDRKEISKILNIPLDKIPTQNSYAYNEIFEAVERGEIKGLWIIATNPAHSWINRSQLDSLIKKLDFCVVQDMYYSTETCGYADLVLPAAGWGEKSGTVINSERRFGLYQKVRKAPGQALSDFYIFKLIAEEWGVGEMFREWETPEATFQILKKISKGKPWDITGIKDYEMLYRHGGIQWPFSQEMAEMGPPQTHRRLFEDGQYYHEGGKAKFIFDYIADLYEPTNKEYPFTLLTGRGSSAQWHTLTRTGKSKILNKLAPKELYVEIHPFDAEERAFEQGQKIWVFSRRGKANALVNITPNVKPGEVFMPMHFAETNLLTYPIFDPHSKQPSYKACAVQLSRQ